MIVEVLSVLAVLVGGCALVRTAGIGGWALAPLGFLAGTALQITVGLVQVVSRLPTTPALTLAVTAGAPLVWWVGRRRAGHDVAVPWRPAVAGLAGVAAAVGVLRLANLVKWTPDSFDYAIAGTLLAGGDYDAAATLELLTKRLLSTPLVHAPANLDGGYYLASVTPLLAVSTVAALVWLVVGGLRPTLSPRRLIGYAALAGLLLVSMNRFVFHAFYINGHLLFAALVLLIVGCGWLLVSDAGIPARALMTLQLVAVPALVVTRAEAWIVAVLAVLPTLLTERVPARYRMALLATLGASVVAWSGHVALALAARGAPMTLAVIETVVGAALVVLAPLLRWSSLARAPRRWLWAAEGGLWLALLAFAVREPEILWASVVATARNAVYGRGSWGASLVLLSLLVLGVLVFAAIPHEAHLRFPLTAFVPLAFLLAHLRGIAYRVGDGDSLNRMFLQFVPLAVLYVVVALASGERRRYRGPAAGRAGQPDGTGQPDGAGQPDAVRGAGGTAPGAQDPARTVGV